MRAPRLGFRLALVFAVAAFALTGSTLFAQAGAPARRITAGADLPAACISSVVIRDIFYKSGSNAGLYVCTAANTWTLQSGLADVVGPASSTENGIAVFSDTTGKLLGSSTVTLSAGILDGLSIGNVAFGLMSISATNGNGIAFPTAGVALKNGTVGAALTFDLSSLSVNRIITVPDAAGTLTLGGNTFSGTGSVMLAAMPTLTDTLFAALGTPANGTIAYCSDCTKATPCAGSGTGAIAKRLNGAWDCD